MLFEKEQNIKNRIIDGMIFVISHLGLPMINNFTNNFQKLIVDNLENKHEKRRDVDMENKQLGNKSQSIINRPII